MGKENEVDLNDLVVTDNEQSMSDVTEDAVNNRPVEDVTAAPDDSGDESWLPEKFKGKSKKEIIEVYQNLEKEHGRKSNDMNDLRRQIDQVLLQPVQDQQQPAGMDDSVKFDDLVDNPEDAVNRALAKNPILREIQQRDTQQRMESSKTALLKRHPDAEQVVNDEVFVEWLNESPGRAAIFRQAHQSYDVSLAADLLDTFKYTKKAAHAEAEQQRDNKAREDLRKGTVESGTGADAGRADPIFSRKALIELRHRDPARYNSILPEVERAYADGRVKDDVSTGGVISGGLLLGR